LLHLIDELAIELTFKNCHTYENLGQENQYDMNVVQNSQMSARLPNLLDKMTVELTFENFISVENVGTKRKGKGRTFSKVTLLLNLPYGVAKMHTMS